LRFCFKLRQRLHFAAIAVSKSQYIMKKWFLRISGYTIALAFLALAVGPLIGIKAWQFAALFAQAATMEGPVEAVSEVRVEAMRWDVALTGIGTLTAPQGVVLASETAGIIKAIYFDNGQKVAAGQLLIELDNSVERAELESAKASVELAEIEFVRAQQLFERDATPQNQFDRARISLRQARAKVATLEALLDKKTIRAPFAGTTGIRAINLGQLVSPGTPLVGLQNLATLEVRFALPQNELQQVAEGLWLEVYPDVEGGKAYAGELIAIDPLVDERSRSLHLLGSIANEANELRPGMFVRVRVKLEEAREVLTVPNTAIIAAAYGNSVYALVEDEDSGHLIARQRFIRTGERRGDYIEIVEGLQAGDRVVSAGGFKLRNNARVRISQLDTPDAQLAPTPQNR
jgi:membrane fusion protein (multidrug efflux system)